MCILYLCKNYSIHYSIGASLGGSWIFDDYSPGNTHHFGANRIDTNGVFSGGFEVWRGSNTYFSSIKLMSDSSYLLSNQSASLSALLSWKLQCAITKS